jgi:excisionase family DNA binding protein
MKPSLRSKKNQTYFDRFEIMGIDDDFSNLVSAVEELKHKIDLLLSQQKLSEPPLVQEILDKEYLSVNEAAILLGCTKSNIYTKICRGKLPYIKYGKHVKLEKTELLKYMKSGKRLTSEQLIAASKNFVK